PEILSVHRHRDAGDPLVETRQALDVGGDDTDRDEIHDVSLGGRSRDAAQFGCIRPLLTARCQHAFSRVSAGGTAMRRADRLFQIIQVLRGATQPVTASQLAAELEVSQRSVYRDVADLIGQRVPIRGEAGIGYVLDRDFDMPPLMLTPDELEA